MQQKQQNLDQIQQYIQDYKSPNCLTHKEEKLIRICINPQCNKYFELACMDCLDSHNHNIQELIKLKDFFQILQDQTHQLNAGSGDLEKQMQNFSLNLSKESDKENNINIANQQKNNNNNDYEIVGLQKNNSFSDPDDDEENDFEIHGQKAGLPIKQKIPEKNEIQQYQQQQQYNPSIEEMKEISEKFSQLQQKYSKIQQNLLQIDDSIKKEKNLSPQAQVREILGSILQKGQKNPSEALKHQQELQKSIMEIKPLIVRNKSVKITSGQQQQVDKRIERFSQVYIEQLQNVEREIEKLLEIDFQQFNNDTYDSFSFSKNLRGNKTILTLKNKGIMQNGNEQRFILMEPKIDIHKKNRWALQIVSIGTWAGIGIANKNIIVREKFEFTKYTGNGLHGSYLVSNNGYSWNYRDSKQNMTVNNFNFTTGDTILIEYNPTYKKLIFLSVSQRKFVCLDLQNIEAQDDHLPCVNLCQGSNIKIDDDFVWPNSDIIRGYKGYSDISMNQLFE